MLRAIKIVLMAALLGAIIAAIASGRSRVSSLQSAVASSPAAYKQPGPETSMTSNETTHARNVGGGKIPASLPAEQPLERVGALPQPTPPKKPQIRKTVEKKPEILRWRLVYNAVAVSAGILQANDLTLVLSGIDTVSDNETCRQPGGPQWPCGTVARTAFRNFLQGRALNCHLPDYSTVSSLEAECLIAGQDPAEWLISQGWARAKSGSPMEEKARAAKIAGRGIYGAPPPGVQSVAE